MFGEGDVPVSETEVAMRAIALDAALEELQQWGLDRFSIEGVAHRSRLTPDYLRQTWSSDSDLIVEAMRRYTDLMLAVPDTGSLRGDLTELALSIGAYLNEPMGRRIARMSVIDTKSAVVDSDTRLQFWSLRRQKISSILARASARGELRDDVSATLAMHLLTSPMNTLALYSDVPIDPGYCRAIADLVTRAVSAGV